jgi:thiamine thiazole synthase
MELNERLITEAIVSGYFAKFKDSLDLDVAIVGGGPAGLTAARFLASWGRKTALFERKLSVGGGMWGGGMCYNIIVVQEESRHLLEDVGVPLSKYGENIYTADAVAATSTLASKAALAGARIFNCVSVEDVVVRETGGQTRVAGLVINSSPVMMAGLHVDPLVIHSRFAVEATGHDVEVLKTLVRKNGVRLNTPGGGIEGEKSMWAEAAEARTPENTREIFPGLYVAGMAANAAYGDHRMGPVFGGMLLSGEKAAREIHARLG